MHGPLLQLSLNGRCKILTFHFYGAEPTLTKSQTTPGLFPLNTSSLDVGRQGRFRTETKDFILAKPKLSGYEPSEITNPVASKAL